jgi:hypothetical protein
MEIFTQPPTTKGPAETFTGDTICAVPDEEHWHGAAPGRFMATWP